MDDKALARLAGEADMILKTELFGLIMQEFTSGVCDRWKNGHFVSVEDREDAYHQVRAAEQFKTRLQNYIDDIKFQGAAAKARAKAKP